MKAKSKAVVRYWAEFYADGVCTLCANTGIVDTIQTAMYKGENVGRRQFCVCPNGQEMRDDVIKGRKSGREQTQGWVDVIMKGRKA